MTNRDSLFFRALCLKPEKREIHPIFTDNNIEIRLLPNKCNNIYTLQINSVGSNSLRLNVVSNQEDFKILG